MYFLALGKFVADSQGMVDVFWILSGIKAAMKKAGMQSRIGQFNDAFGFCDVIFCE